MSRQSKIVEQLIGERTALLSQGDIYGAISRIAEAYAIDPSVVFRYDVATFPEQTRQVISEKAATEFQRACRILSTGSSWEFEEILLVLTLNEELHELVALCIEYFGWDLCIDLSKLETLIDECTSDAEFAKQRQEAQARMLRVKA